MILHICKAGEDVFSIGRQYGVSPVKILEDNGKGGHSPLWEGEVLLLFPALPLYRMERREGLTELCRRIGVSKGRLLRQNPTLCPGRLGLPGKALYGSAGPLPGLCVIGRADGGDYPHIKSALPYLDGLVLAGGRMRRGRVELPRRGFLPENLAVFAEVSLEDCTAGEAEILWQRCREEGYQGMVADCKEEEAASRLAAHKREGEVLFSYSHLEGVEGVLGGSIPTLPLGGLRKTGKEERRLSEEEKDLLLDKWHLPIARGEEAVAHKTLYLAGSTREESVSFLDLAMKKALLDRWAEEGIHSIFIPSIRDLSLPVRMLLGNAFDRTTPFPTLPG